MAGKKELEALITIAGKIDPSLQAAMVKAQGETKKTSKEMEKMNTISNKLGGALKYGVAIGAGIGVAAITTLASKSIEAADGLLKMSDKTGLNVEELQKLQYVANQTGADFEGIQKATTILTKNMASAKAGSKDTAAAFKILGIKVTDATGKLRPQGEVLNETMYQLSMMENQAERNALAFKLFGKGASDLFPILNQGPDKVKAMADEASKLGMVMSEDTVNALDEFGDTMDKVKSTLMGLVNEGLGSILPALTPVLNSFASNVPAAAETAGRVLGDVGDALTVIADNSNWLIPVLGGVVGGFVAFQTISFVSGIITAIGAAGGIGAIGVSALAFATSALGVAVAFVTSPIFLVALAIGAVVGVAIALWKNWDLVNAKLKQGGQIIQGVFTAAIQSIITKINGFIKVLNMIPGVNIKMIGTTENAVKTAYSDDTSGAIRTDPTMEKFALGGYSDKAAIFGEAGPEMAIPLKRTQRNLGLLEKTAQILGVKVGGGVSKIINLHFHIADKNDVPNLKRVVKEVLEEIMDDEGRVEFA